MPRQTTTEKPPKKRPYTKQKVENIPQLRKEFSEGAGSIPLGRFMRLAGLGHLGLRKLKDCGLIPSTGANGNLRISEKNWIAATEALTNREIARIQKQQQMLQAESTTDGPTEPA